MQGAALYVTFKALSVALALLEATERLEALEAEPAERRKPQRPPSFRSSPPA
jgi:hypothetical protein